MNSIYKEKYEKEGKKSFPIGFKSINTERSLIDGLKQLPTSGRSRISAFNTKVPEGYTVEAVMAGLSLPTDLTFAPDGTLFVCEGGSSWPTRPYMPSRIIRQKPSGETDAIQMDVEGGSRGIAYKDGELYISIKGGYFTRIVKYNLETGKLTTLINQLPNGAGMNRRPSFRQGWPDVFRAGLCFATRRNIAAGIYGRYCQTRVGS